MNIYPSTLTALATTLQEFDEISDSFVSDDIGLLFGSMPLYSTDNRLIGAVNWDEDQHPYFTPAEDDYDEEEPEDGEKSEFFQLDDPAHFANVIEPSNVVSLDEFRKFKVG